LRLEVEAVRRRLKAQRVVARRWRARAERAEEERNELRSRIVQGGPGPQRRVDEDFDGARW
jgi:hypothetical protein